MDILRNRLILSAVMAMLIHAAILFWIDKTFEKTVIHAPVSKGPIYLMFSKPETKNPLSQNQETPEEPERISRDNSEIPDDHGSDLPTAETITQETNNQDKQSKAYISYKPSFHPVRNINKYPVMTPFTKNVPEHVMTEPLPNIPIEPVYPLTARLKGYEGTTVVIVQISSTGIILGADIEISSGYDILDKASLDSVKQKIFSPGTIDNQPVNMALRVKFDFTLQ